ASPPRSYRATQLLGILSGFILGYTLFSRLLGAGWSVAELREAPPPVTVNPLRPSPSSNDSQEEKDSALNLRENEEGRLRLTTENREQANMAERVRAQAASLPIPGFALVGMGHLPFDLPNAPQPGNVTAAECALTCNGQPGCHGFAWFVKPAWSRVSECYLKNRNAQAIV
ncbi:MAG: hypothetical protein SGPRY_009537, partial [Prymnesium sp.]